MENKASVSLLIQKFCGPMGLESANLLSLHVKDTIHSWYNNQNVIYFHKARAAIRYICQLLAIKPGDTILAPSFNCGVEIDPILKSGAFVVLYRVDKSGKIDVADLQKRIDANTRIIYVTQYFGFPQPIEPIREICDERGIYLVEDCALSLLSTGNNNRKMGSTGDISIFNLYKTLPLPDGGAMIINNPALIHDPPVMFASPQARVTMEFIKLFQHFVFHKIPLANAFYAGIRNLKNKNNTRREVRDNIRHNFSDMLASYYYDENLSLRRMSFVSKYMLNRYDYNRVVHNRRRNFKKYLHDLRDTETMHFLYPDLPEGICPLYFPILVDNPGYICKQLYRYSIFTYHWWSGYHKDLPWSDFPEACYLKDHLLALPVHQQLQETKIDYIIQKLLKVMRESQY